MKNALILGACVVVAVAAVWFWVAKTSTPVAVVPAPSPAPVVVPPDYKNISYIIAGKSVTLVNGYAATATASSSAMTTTNYFGNEATGDVNGDGAPDTVFLLTQSGGGSGTFYYVVAALKTADGYQGTNAILLGDRIAPQTTEIKNGQIVVNYAERKKGEPMTAKPSVGVSAYLNVSGTTLSETAPVAGAGEHCGGNMTTARTCATGFHCAPAPGSHLPFGDVGGTCVAD